MLMSSSINELYELIKKIGSVRSYLHNNMCENLALVASLNLSKIDNFLLSLAPNQLKRLQMVQNTVARSMMRRTNRGLIQSYIYLSFP